MSHIVWNRARTVVVGVRATSSDWQLYTSSEDLIDDCYEATAQLNESFVTAINAFPLNRDMIRETVHRIMMQHKHTGAADSEPDGFLADLLSEVYGFQIDRFE